MSNKSQTTSGGIGFLGILTIVFITLKLTGNIDWSWWYVLMPMYIFPALIIAVIATVGPVIYLLNQIKRMS